jgi:hypothetical protein
VIRWVRHRRKHRSPAKEHPITPHPGLPEMDLKNMRFEAEAVETSRVSPLKPGLTPELHAHAKSSTRFAPQELNGNLHDIYAEVESQQARTGPMPVDEERLSPQQDQRSGSGRQTESTISNAEAVANSNQISVPLSELPDSQAELQWLNEEEKRIRERRARLFTSTTRQGSEKGDSIKRE